MTGQDVINGALRLVGAIASGENPTTQESADALEVLNNMLDSWNAQKLAIYSVTPNTFPLVAGQQDYTIGTGANFNMTRPARIEGVSILTQQAENGSLLELPIHYMTTLEWQQVPVKSIESLLPMEVWDDQGWPNRTLRYWPIPNAAGVSTIIYSWNPLASFADLITDYTFPPAYAKAIRYNLAVDLAPEFGVQQVNPLVIQQANASLGILKAMNSDIMTEAMQCDPALVSPGGRIFDWRTGSFLHGGIR